MSSLIAIVVAIAWMATYLVGKESWLRFDPGEWKPRLQLGKKMLAIGLPAGFGFGVTAVYLAIVYSISGPFGAAAQAGFGIGTRVVQAGFMTVVALGFAVAPVAGQNFGCSRKIRPSSPWERITSASSRGIASRPA